MIYLPNINYPCYVIQDKDTIRAYHTQPYNPGYNQSVAIAYTDYYINSHYLEKEGSQNFNYNTTLPTCINKNNLTNEFYYRNDFDSILIIFMIIVIFGIYLPIKIFSRLFKRGNL